MSKPFWLSPLPSRPSTQAADLETVLCLTTQLVLTAHHHLKNLLVVKDSDVKCEHYHFRPFFAPQRPDYLHWVVAIQYKDVLITYVVFCDVYQMT